MNVRHLGILGLLALSFSGNAFAAKRKIASESFEGKTFVCYGPNDRNQMVAVSVSEYSGSMIHVNVNPSGDGVSYPEVAYYWPGSEPPAEPISHGYRFPLGSGGSIELYPKKTKARLSGGPVIDCISYASGDPEAPSFPLGYSMPRNPSNPSF